MLSSAKTDFSGSVIVQSRPLTHVAHNRTVSVKTANYHWFSQINLNYKVNAIPDLIRFKLISIELKDISTRIPILLEYQIKRCKLFHSSVVRNISIKNRLQISYIHAVCI